MDPWLKTFRTGVSVPLFSLQSARSEGCGDFEDLAVLAEWCAGCGLEIIQILPINDTGDDPSPFGVTGSLTINPAYLRVAAVDGWDRLDEENREAYRRTIKVLETSSVPEIRKQKLACLRKIYDRDKTTIRADKDFAAFVSQRDWVQAWGVFLALKDQHHQAAWHWWREEYQQGSPAMVERFLKSSKAAEDVAFHGWVQYLAHCQLLAAREKIEQRGVRLKVDMPILVSEDSFDVWYHRTCFNLVLHVGTPPDQQHTQGQNWGYPLFNWDQMEKNGYQWWRERISWAAQYFHSFRLDHVLGLFRLWTVPRKNNDGVLGYFKPGIYITQSELQALGFDHARIRWLSEPHVPGQRLYELFGMRAIEIIGRCFVRIGSEELYLFKPEIEGEKDILDLPIIQDEKDSLIQIYRDRTLLKVDEQLYSPVWTFRDCWRYHILNDDEKSRFENLLREKEEESEHLWRQQGERVLQAILQGNTMISCAEDLGAVPRCVRETLEKLGILGMVVPRWARDYESPGSPVIRPEDYRPLTVCAPSVHDSSTLRGWWAQEPDRDRFWHSLDLPDPVPVDLDAPATALILERMLRANSVWVVPQLSDWLALEEQFHREPEMDRINEPGKVSERNWRYRMPLTLDGLMTQAGLAKHIKNLVQARRKRKPVYPNQSMRRNG